MKNQYLCDIGDYGKYGLLHFLCNSGIKLGVNWYLTGKDGSSDGNHKEYLSDEKMRQYDPIVYKAMQQINAQKNKTIQMVEQSGFLENACYYDDLMDFSSHPWRQRAAARNHWHSDALQRLKDAELVFADPDNSLSMRKKPTQKDAEKFLLPNELIDYFCRDQQVLYYHHRSRKNAEGWLVEKRQILNCLPDAKLLAVSFHRWTSRTYIFVLHSEQFEKYQEAVHAFLATEWGTLLMDGKAAFTEEPI